MLLVRIPVNEARNSPARIKPRLGRPRAASAVHSDSHSREESWSPQSLLCRENGISGDPLDRPGTKQRSPFISSIRREQSSLHHHVGAEQMVARSTEHPQDTFGQKKQSRSVRDALERGAPTVDLTQLQDFSKRQCGRTHPPFARAEPRIAHS